MTRTTVKVMNKNGKEQWGCIAYENAEQAVNEAYAMARKNARYGWTVAVAVDMEKEVAIGERMHEADWEYHEAGDR